MASLRGADLLLATGNSGKVAEFSALFLPFGVRLHGLRDHGLAEPEETGASFSANALLKARAAWQATGMSTLADDSGLEVAGLGGAPGIYTADWAETSGGRDFGLAMRKTWGLLTAVAAPQPRLASFCCVLALVWPDGREETFEGRVAGEIVWPMRGVLGHGYDPIFRPHGQSLTLGEMDPAAKNLISHRAVAVSKLIDRCFT